MSSPAADIPNTLAVLRATTRPLHNQLEHHTDGNRLFAAGFDEVHYRRFVTTHHAFHGLVADVVGHQHHRNWLDWPECARMAALADDLAALDAVALPIEALAAPLTAEADDNAAFVTGFVYVAEGACHGNQHILKALSRHQAFRTLGAGRFLEMAAATVEERWPNMLGLVEDAGRVDIDALVAGAASGFENFGRLWDQTA